MATSKNVKQYSLFGGTVTAPTTTSLGASFTSVAVDLTQYDRCSLEMSIITADAVGTFTIQASNSGSSWTDMSLSAMTLAGASTVIFLDFLETGVKFIRVSYTRSAGTGTVSVIVNGKES